MRKRKCIVNECERAVVAKQMCQRHYYQVQRKGHTYKTTHGLTLEEALFSQLGIPDNPDDCWIFSGPIKGNGYGNVKGQPAHRVMWELIHGEIKRSQPDRFVLHTCDQKLCCNISHLYRGSHTDNMRDVRERSLKQKGSNHWHTNFTDKDVLEIRRLHATGEYSYQKIAAQYRVGVSAIAAIVHRKTWKHLPPEDTH